MCMATGPCNNMRTCILQIPGARILFDDQICQEEENTIFLLVTNPCNFLFFHELGQKSEIFK